MSDRVLLLKDISTPESPVSLLMTLSGNLQRARLSCYLGEQCSALALELQVP